MFAHRSLLTGRRTYDLIGWGGRQRSHDRIGSDPPIVSGLDDSPILKVGSVRLPSCHSISPSAHPILVCCADATYKVAYSSKISKYSSNISK